MKGRIRRRHMDVFKRQLQDFGDHLAEAAPLSCSVFGNTGKDRGRAARIQTHMGLRHILAHIGLAMDPNPDPSPLWAFYPCRLELTFPFLFPAELLCAFLHGLRVIGRPGHPPVPVPLLSTQKQGYWRHSAVILLFQFFSSSDLIRRVEAQEE